MEMLRQTNWFQVTASSVHLRAGVSFDNLNAQDVTVVPVMRSMATELRVQFARR